MSTPHLPLTHTSMDQTRTITSSKKPMASSKKLTRSFALEVESLVSAARMFKAAVLDWHNLGPKLIPEIIASGTTVIEGEGGVGSVRQLNFTSVAPFSFVKERLDFIDHEKFECKSTVLEGGYVSTILESASAHFKIEPTSSGGSICKVVTESKLRAGTHAGDEATEAQKGLGNVKLFNTAEAYLLANPDAYV